MRRLELGPRSLFAATLPNGTDEAGRFKERLDDELMSPGAIRFGHRPRAVACKQPMAKSWGYPSLRAWALAAASLLSRSLACRRAAKQRAATPNIIRNVSDPNNADTGNDSPSTQWHY